MEEAQRLERARELERKYQARKGHTPHISISDDSHHVTEAIGDMYGRDRSDSDPKRHSRPLSFIGSSQNEGSENFLTFSFERKGSRLATGELSPTQDSWFPSNLGESSSNSQTPNPVARTTSDDRTPTSTTNAAHGPAAYRPPPRSSSFSTERAPTSPPPLHRSSSETATTGFPLNDIDYESSPAAVAQELSNLQAIRRMSMDVNAMDPDLPSFNSGFKMPSIAPSGSSDDPDPSGLFWVPARVHPELAPKEFKDFIEHRVKTLKRRSGDENGSLLPPSLDRVGSGGGLRRKKSMLSRQIDSGSGYLDGADRLERKRSLASRRHPDSGVNLSTLEEIVSEPKTLAHRLSVETNRQSIESVSDAGGNPEDMPIITAKPGGTLKRSTRTTYRRGSLKKGERVPFSKRVANRHGDLDRGESPSSSPVAGRDEMTEMPQIPELPDFKLSRAHTEPISSMSSPIENFSRPSRRAMSPPLPSTSPSPPPSEPVGHFPGGQKPEHRQADPGMQQRRTSPPQRAFHSRIASNGRTSAQLPGYNVPDIVETPPAESQGPPQHYYLPERTSSHEPPPSQPPQAPLPNRPSPQRTPVGRPAPQPQRLQKSPNQSLDEIASHPSPLPGSNTRTDSLSFIPTVEEKKSDKKKDKRDVSDGSGKKSWWSFGGDDKSKDREDKKSKSKLSRPGPKDDSTRLDVLQSSIDGRGGGATSPSGRESLVLDRESIKLDEARRETNRKSSSDSTKKEKDTSLFSSLFGGSKKNKTATLDPNAKHKQSSSRGRSPDPGPRILRPDIDYNWTRFSILEERAIYRMAHIKLANPRRELYSQVLLSNFMYSYLAKVQQMHPQIQIPQSAAQKQAQRQQQEAAKKQKEKEEREAMMRKREEEEREREREREQREREQRERERLAEDENLFAGYREHVAATSPSPPLGSDSAYVEYDLSNEPPDDDHYSPSHHDHHDDQHAPHYNQTQAGFDRNDTHVSGNDGYSQYQNPSAHQSHQSYQQHSSYSYDRNDRAAGGSQGYSNGMKQNGYTVGGSDRYLGIAGPSGYGTQDGSSDGPNGHGYGSRGQRDTPYLQLKHEPVSEPGRGRFWGEGLD